MNTEITEDVIKTERGVAVIRTAPGIFSVRYDTIAEDGTRVRGKTTQYRGRVPFTVIQQLDKYRAMQGGAR